MYAESSVGCLLCYCAMLRLKIAHHSAVAQVNSTVPLGDHFPWWCMLVAVTFQNSQIYSFISEFDPSRSLSSRRIINLAHYWNPEDIENIEWGSAWRRVNKENRCCMFPSMPRMIFCGRLLIARKLVQFDYRKPTAVLDNTHSVTDITSK